MNYNLKKLPPIDLILSCGDLHPHYLSYIATYCHAPILYVHGNHDDCYAEMPPLGCICIENQIYTHHGLRILGLGGSARYRNGEHQYTQFEMNWRVRKLTLSLLRHRGFDVLLTHAPALAINDGSDPVHKGFLAFRYLLEHYQPTIMVHGHTHLTYGRQYSRLSTYKQTKIINAYDYYLIKI